MSDQVGNHYEDSRRVKIIALNIDKCSAKYDDLFPSARIFKVPEDLRKHNGSAYTPRLIAIGPLHRKDRHLQTPMQHIKSRYTKALILEASKNIVGGEKNYEVVLGECLKKLKGCISKAKKYYAEVDSARKNDAEDVTRVCKGQKYNAEEVEMVEDKTLEMMLVDGCFILRLLWLSYQRKELVEAAIKASSSVRQRQDEIDPIFDNVLTGAIVKQDLILLENQIPFFVLEHLFEVTVAMISGANKLPLESLEYYVRSYWESYIERPESENSGSKKTSCCLPVDCVLWVGDCVLSDGHRSTKESAQAGKADQYHHILHLLHDFCLPGDLGENFNRKDSTKFSELKVSAADLHYAGVEFLNHPSCVHVWKPEGIRRHFNGIRFYIPSLLIHPKPRCFGTVLPYDSEELHVLCESHEHAH